MKLNNFSSKGERFSIFINLFRRYITILFLLSEPFRFQNDFHSAKRSKIDLPNGDILPIYLFSFYRSNMQKEKNKTGEKQHLFMPRYASCFFAIRVLAPNCSDRWSTVGSKRRDASTIVIKRDRVIQISFVPRKDEMDRVPSSWKKPLLLHRQSFESTNKLRNAHKLYSREANRSFRGDRCLTTNVFIYCEFYTRADRTLLGICIRIFPDEFGMHALVWIIWVSNMSDSFENISL